MKRDFKLSSVLIVQIISAIILALLNSLLGPSLDPYNSRSLMQTLILYSFPAWIITSLVRSVTGFIIARGLLKDRFGSVGDYLNKISDFSFAAFGVILIIQFIIGAIPTILVIIFVPIILASLMASEGAAFFLFILLILVAAILSILLEVFSYYTYFVVADKPNINSIGATLREAFTTSKALLGKSFEVFFKYIIIPVVIFIVVMYLGQAGSSGGALLGGLSISIMVMAVIGAICYGVVIRALLYGEFSNLYLDYKGNYEYLNREF